MAQQSDEQLVRWARTGDRQAFGTLIERHRPMLLRLIDSRTNDPQWTGDIVQEAVLQAYLSLDTLRESSRFRPWLCGIALNIWRTQNRRGAVLPLDAVDRVSEPSLEELAERIESRRALLAGLRPRNERFYREPLPVFTGWPDAPCAYLSFAPGYEVPAAEARAQGWAYREINAGHFHMLVAPGEVAATLIALLDETEVGPP